jgi:hypothetical protein
MPFQGMCSSSLLWTSSNVVFREFARVALYLPFALISIYFSQRKRESLLLLGNGQFLKRFITKGFMILLRMNVDTCSLENINTSTTLISSYFIRIKKLNVEEKKHQRTKSVNPVLFNFSVLAEKYYPNYLVLLTCYMAHYLMLEYISITNHKS